MRLQKIRTLFYNHLESKAGPSIKVRFDSRDQKILGCEDFLLVEMAGVEPASFTQCYVCSTTIIRSVISVVT